jgi:hypothetical protein
MCLQTVSKIKPKSSGFGYKVFKVLDGGKLQFSFVGAEAPRKEWLKANNHGGFHIYTEQQKAEQNVRWHEHLYKDRHQRPIYKVFRVQYRNATEQGIGDGGYTKNARVVIAQEIFILY